MSGEIDMRKILGDAHMTTDNALERALHKGAVTRNEEEVSKPYFSAIQ